jgi:hypothetical protein
LGEAGDGENYRREAGIVEKGEKINTESTEKNGVHRER